MQRGHHEDAAQILQALWMDCLETDGGDGSRCAGRGGWRERSAEHLPLTLQVIQSRLEALEYGIWEEGLGSGEQVLLLTVGFSEEQLALSMAVHAGAGCRWCVPVAPLEVWARVAPRVRHCLGLLGDDLGELQLDDPQAVCSNDPASTFRAMTAWARAHPGLRLAIDCTGGQKPMVAGAADAASFLGLPAYYLDFDGYDPDRRRPLPHTSRYRRLALADQVLSLPQRRATLEAFTSRRFDLAAVRAAEVHQAARACGYFQEREVTAARSAHLLAERSREWMELRYDHPMLQDHPLHQLFASSRREEAVPRAIVEALQAEPEGDRLAAYVADELWRLEVLVQLGARREALVGLVGLVELVVDALMFLPWFAGVTVESVAVRPWVVPGRTEPPLPSAADLGWVGSVLPPALLPPGSQQQKISLMRRGAARFDVWVALDDHGVPRLDQAPPGRNEPRLEVGLRVRTAAPPLAMDGGARVRDRHWARCWGGYPQGDWVLQRHASVHLRAPLFDTGSLGQALEVAPRFIELLYRLRRGISVNLEASGAPEWVTWWHDPAWSRRARLPWGADGDASMARWLGLPAILSTSPADAAGEGIGPAG